jgi:hypothetical protein
LRCHVTRVKTRKHQRKGCTAVEEDSAEALDQGIIAFVPDPVLNLPG